MERHNYAIKTYAEIFPYGASEEKREDYMREIRKEYGEKFGEYSLEMERLATEMQAISMLESCWCYGEMHHFYEKYYAEYKERYTVKYYGNINDLNRAVEIQLAYLVTKCEIVRNTFTDNEGISYSAIVEK